MTPFVITSVINLIFTKSRHTQKWITLIIVHQRVEKNLLKLVSRRTSHTHISHHVISFFTFHESNFQENLFRSCCSLSHFDEFDEKEIVGNTSTFYGVEQNDESNLLLCAAHSNIFHCWTPVECHFQYTVRARQCHCIFVVRSTTWAENCICCGCCSWSSKTEKLPEH